MPSRNIYNNYRNLKYFITSLKILINLELYTAMLPSKDTTMVDPRRHWQLQLDKKTPK